jgi:hypothetical protein
MAQMVENLPGKYKAMSLNSLSKRKYTTQEQKVGGWQGATGQQRIQVD